tara:strand:+ start:75 stop:1025 length:951 start_codon:yes stop_codon:yes gene_type:complete
MAQPWNPDSGIPYEDWKRWYDGLNDPRNQYTGETIPYYPGVKEPNIFQDAKRRGLAGVIGGALDNLTMGATDFDRRGDSAFQKGTKDFLKSFVFGEDPNFKPDGTPRTKPDLPEGREIPVIPNPESEEKTTTQKVEEFLDPIDKTLEERVQERDNAPDRVADEFGRLYPDKNDPDFLDPRIGPDGQFQTLYIPELDDPNWKPPYPDGRKKIAKTTTQKVEEFLDPTGEQAEKRLDSINIGGEDYKIYTDKNTGEEFIPFDPRISGNKGDFDRYGKPLTEEQKRMLQQGARIGSFIPNPYTEEQMREIGRENLKLNL